MLFCLLVLILTGTSSGQNIYLFDDPVFYSTGNGSLNSAAEDFNADGYPDIAVLNYGSSSVSILLNNGNGAFQNQTNYQVMSHPYQFKVADFNHDYFPDIAVTCFDANIVSYLENNGDGTFKAMINSYTQSQPWGIDAYDFNRDDFLDIAVANKGSGTFQILLNNQDGTFTSSYTKNTGDGPYFLTIGDVNGDDYPEIVITRDYPYLFFTISALTIFNNNQDGTFTKYVDYEYGATASNIYIYDFNDDSYSDIITNTFRENMEEMCFFINDGYGNFGEPITTFDGHEGAFTMADFDLNGYMDFAVPEYQYNATAVAILLNNGNFNFDPVFTIGAGEQPRHPANGDFDLDGDLDLAVPLYYEDKVAVFMNKTTIVPVELTTFSAVAFGNNVNLKWSTATEKNNKGFEVQRSKAEGQKSEWRKIGFVEGKGTATDEQQYSFIDKEVSEGNYTYRLKQIDFNGAFNYSNEVNVEIKTVYTYSMNQNYPNPFNPSTTIQYSIPEDGNVSLRVYNTLGEEVVNLVNNNQQPGIYKIIFNAETLGSGIYFYRLDINNYSSVKKMILMK